MVSSFSETGWKTSSSRDVDSHKSHTTVGQGRWVTNSYRSGFWFSLMNTQDVRQGSCVSNSFQRIFLLKYAHWVPSRKLCKQLLSGNLLLNGWLNGVFIIRVVPLPSYSGTKRGSTTSLYELRTLFYLRLERLEHNPLIE